MTRDVDVRIRRLIVPASIAGDRDALAGDVIASIERHVGGRAGAGSEPIEAGTRPIAARIAETVAESVRVAMPRSSRSNS